MSKAVKVTSAQVKAAQTLVKRAAERGDSVPAPVQKIAGAKPRLLGAPFVAGTARSARTS